MSAWILVFIAYTALDFTFARYTKATADNKPLAASLWATSILMFTGYVTVSYVNDPWLLIPATLGAFLGTYVAVHRASKAPA